VVLFFLIAGCARPPLRIETQPLPDIGTLLNQIEENQQALRDFEGFGRLIIQTPSLRQAYGVHVFYRAPAAYRISFQGVLGLELGSITIVNNEFSIQSLASFVSMQGTLDDAPIEDMLGPALDSHELLELLNPLIQVDNVPQNAEIRRDIELQRYQLTWRDSTVYHYWIEPFHPVASRMLLTTQKGDTLWYRNCGRIKDYSGIAFPSEWETQISEGRAAHHINVKFSTLKINRGLSPSLFKIES
jgi:hypothetical protein